jgi:penicillin-binding protein 1A
VLVGGVAFAVGGYLGLIEGVRKLDEPRTYETHPTYIYSAPLGGNEDSRRVIGTIFEGQNRNTASLSEMPPHLLDAVVAKEDERFREHGGERLGLQRLPVESQRDQGQARRPLQLRIIQC